MKRIVEPEEPEETVNPVDQEAEELADRYARAAGFNGNQRAVAVDEYRELLRQAAWMEATYA